jgi:hypothetical protein
MSPQIFGRAANLLARLTILGAVLGLAALVVATLFLVRSPWATAQGVPVDQVVPFSHKHHVGDDGIDCRYCHTSVEHSSFAGMPPTQTCMNCHSQIWSQSPILEPVRRSAQSGQPLEWDRVHVLADFVYFDHSIHVQKGIGCSTCHGQVDQMPLMWKASSLQMSWCLDCHRNPERYVRPREEVFNVDWQPPPNQAEVGARLVQDYLIQSKTSCSTCHR